MNRPAKSVHNCSHCSGFNQKYAHIKWTHCQAHINWYFLVLLDPGTPLLANRSGQPLWPTWATNERQYSFVATTIQPATPARRLEPVIWWRWAVVLVPGILLYFFPLLGLNPQQSRLFGVFVATIIALVAQPVRMGVSVVIA